MSSEAANLSRLKWLCRRGMRELDVVMRSYLDNHYERASASEQALFRELLEMPDPDLYALLLGRHETQDPALARFIERLRL